MFTKWLPHASLGNEHIFGGVLAGFFANKYLDLDKVENKYPGLHCTSPSK
jgi:hypothetical protein